MTRLLQIDLESFYSIGGLGCLDDVLNSEFTTYLENNKSASETMDAAFTVLFPLLYDAGTAIAMELAKGSVDIYKDEKTVGGRAYPATYCKYIVVTNHAALGVDRQTILHEPICHVFLGIGLRYGQLTHR
jgi:hypothetical protein